MYCTCKKHNTRQTAFARANKYACPDCGRTLNPDPNAENDQQTDTLIPNRPLSPDSYPTTLSALRSNRGFTPPPSQLQPDNQQQETINTEAQTRDNDNDINATWPNHKPFMAKRTAENHHKCQPQQITDDIRSPPIDPRRDTNASSTQYVSSTNKRDVATDAHELRQHTAQYEKAAMRVRCCPILGVDINGPTPDNEDPSYFYLVL